ncbi:hypothetical protein WR25_01591 [Diploscapter pachys]|uniref:Suv3 N-terminal domain-containing protein n=1 Tax=Diploscapter pachys TaxID=2018661 RepID=A0A2A2KPR7_9BILA|nr:hypothetical protein WR25_01591 [Diploscapter pachys]
MSWNAGRQLQVLLRGRSCLVALPALPASSSSLYLTLLPTCSKSFHSSPAVSAKKYDDSYRGGRFSKGPSKLEDLVVPRLVRPPKTSVANATEWSKDLDQDSISLVLDEFMRRPMVRKMAAEIGLSDKLFMSAYQNFRSYCLDNLDSIDPALLVAFRDIIKDNHDVELLYDYFIEHSKRVRFYSCS